ncbi:hypothetical protein GY45DRAFT_1102140 [Cubamyces sp. BRFM 1775]|nr:hypothetical protein GY45DRAFT_1102140 [Cubamyces sp. BRFM 1775]
MYYACTISTPCLSVCVCLSVSVATGDSPRSDPKHYTPYIVAHSMHQQDGKCRGVAMGSCEGGARIPHIAQRHRMRPDLTGIHPS